MKDDLANEDLAHLRALTEPKDDMLKRETHLPKASPVCPVCGIAVPHAHDYAGLMTLIVKQKNDLAAAQVEIEQWRNVTDRKDPEDCRAGIKMLCDNWQEARAEAAALRADAERYRWLRMNRLWLKANLPMIAAPELDTAIDQARGAAHETN